MFEDKVKRTNELVNAPAAQPADKIPADGWKVQLKHSMRGLSYGDGAQKLAAPAPETPAPQTPAPEVEGKREKKPPVQKPPVEEKPVEIADPELRTKHQGQYQYQRFGGPLFLNGVKATDVTQGSIADCYLAAALSAIANTHPKAIEDMIKPAGNGAYKVRFFKTGYSGSAKEEWITVDSDLAASAGDVLYSKGTDKDAKGNRELWPALIEKAYAVWKGGYDDIGEGGWSGNVMTAITGKRSDNITLSAMTNDALWKQLQQAVADGKPITAGTHGQDAVNADAALSKKYEEAKVYAWHAYTVMSVEEKKVGDKTERFVTLRNPWGKANRESSTADQGIFTLKYEMFKTVYSSIVINHHTVSG